MQIVLMRSQGYCPGLYASHFPLLCHCVGWPSLVKERFVWFWFR